MDTVDDLVAQQRVRLNDDDVIGDPDAAERNMVKAIEKGLLKTISKMGISTIQSYCGAQIFEAVGLERELIDRHFTGTASRIGGVGMEVLATEALERHARAYPRPHDPLLPVGGIYAWRRDGEHHMWNPETIALVQHAVRAANGSRSRFGEAEITHFAVLNQPRHCANRFLDRDVAVDSVLVIKVDGIDPEPLQARLAGLPDVLGAAIDPGEAALSVAHVAELGREEHLAAAAADRLTHQFLVVAPPVNVGSVQEIQAQVEGPLNGLDRLLIVRGPVEFRHAHASES